MLVAQDLDLDVAGAADQLLQEDLVVAEGGLGLAPAGGDLFGQLVGALDHAHAAAAAAPAGLGHDREADGFRQLRRLRLVAGQGTGRRHDRDAGLLGQVARLDLAAQAPHDRGLGADEGDAGLGAGLGEVGVLGQEAVARVDRRDPGVVGDAQDVLDVQVGGDRFLALADQEALVRLEAVQGEAVLVGIDRHRADAELAGRAQDADGDLAAVGDQQLAERRAWAARVARSHVRQSPRRENGATGRVFRSVTRRPRT